MENNIEKFNLTYKKFFLILIAIILFYFGLFFKENKNVNSNNKMQNLSLIKNKSETIKQINKNTEIAQLNNIKKWNKNEYWLTADKDFKVHIMKIISIFHQKNAIYQKNIQILKLFILFSQDFWLYSIN